MEPFPFSGFPVFRIQIPTSPRSHGVALRRGSPQFLGMREFFTGPVIKTELLVVWLEKHGIAATQQFTDPNAPDNDDLDREARVLVPEADYDRAWQLFFADRQDEL